MLSAETLWRWHAAHIPRILRRPVSCPPRPRAFHCTSLCAAPQSTIPAQFGCTGAVYLAHQLGVTTARLKSFTPTPVIKAKAKSAVGGVQAASAINLTAIGYSVLGQGYNVSERGSQQADATGGKGLSGAFWCLHGCAVRCAAPSHFTPLVDSFPPPSCCLPPAPSPLPPHTPAPSAGDGGPAAVHGHVLAGPRLHPGADLHDQLVIRPGEGVREQGGAPAWGGSMRSVRGTGSRP